MPRPGGTVSRLHIVTHRVLIGTLHAGMHGRIWRCEPWASARGRFAARGVRQMLVSCHCAKASPGSQAHATRAGERFAVDSASSATRNHHGCHNMAHEPARPAARRRSQPQSPRSGPVDWSSVEKGRSGSCCNPMARRQSRDFGVAARLGERPHGYAEDFARSAAAAVARRH
jgi:hypothetical protein